jgi:hypothetical protein
LNAKRNPWQGGLTRSSATGNIGSPTFADALAVTVRLTTEDKAPELLGRVQLAITQLTSPLAALEEVSVAPGTARKAVIRHGSILGTVSSMPLLAISASVNVQGQRFPQSLEAD